MLTAQRLEIDRLNALLAGFPRLSIGLVGDLFLDRYLEIDPDLHELSVETGLEAFQISRIRNSPGALGTVINNLAALGVGRLVPVTVIGEDGQAYDLLKELGRLPVDASHVIQDSQRNTPTYTKPMHRDSGGTWRELNRLDLRNRKPPDESVEAALLEHLERVFRSCHGLIVLDQVNEEGWGVVGPRLRDRLAELSASEPDKLIFIDSRARIGQFRCGVLKANRAECLKATRGVEGQEKVEGLESRVEGRKGDCPTLDPGSSFLDVSAAERLCELTGRPVYCTLGEQGILVVRSGQPSLRVPAFPVSGPVDIVGAGDSATSGIVAALLAGADAADAASVGNLVASITVQQIGTTGTASPQQVRERFQDAVREHP